MRRVINIRNGSDRDGFASKSWLAIRRRYFLPSLLLRFLLALLCSSFDFVETSCNNWTHPSGDSCILSQATSFQLLRRTSCLVPQRPAAVNTCRSMSLPSLWVASLLGDWALEKQLLPGPYILNSVFSVRQETNKMIPVKKSAVYFTVELAGGIEYRFPEVFRVTDLHPCSQDAFSPAFPLDQSIPPPKINIVMYIRHPLLRRSYIFSLIGKNKSGL